MMHSSSFLTLPVARPISSNVCGPFEGLTMATPLTLLFFDEPDEFEWIEGAGPTGPESTRLNRWTPPAWGGAKLDAESSLPRPLRVWGVPAESRAFSAAAWTSFIVSLRRSEVLLSDVGTTGRANGIGIAIACCCWLCCPG